MSNTVRRGNQIPTRAFVLPYDKTYGQDAIKLYQSTGRKAQDWQKLLVFDLLAVNAERTKSLPFGSCMSFKKVRV